VKDYLIWLTGGQFINGTMTDAEAARLMETYKSQAAGVQSFTDTDGQLLLTMDSIQALSINEPGAKKAIGYDQNTGKS
jgi:hypothetical protein